MLIIKIIRHFFSLLIRNLYWLYNLSRIKGIRNTSLHFPIKIEGKGSIKIGRGGSLQKRVSLKVATSAQLTIGEKSILDRTVDIQIGKSGNLIIGNRFSCEYGTRLFSSTTWRLGNNVKIATNCAIFSRESGFQGKLLIGDGTHIGDNTIIDVCGDITIGKAVAIGPNCVIYTHDHDYKQHSKPAWKGGVITKQVKIEDGAWIGSSVTILPGVTIGERAVIAAGAVVTKNVNPKTVVGGVPAKVLNKSKKD